MISLSTIIFIVSVVALLVPIWIIIVSRSSCNKSFRFCCMSSFSTRYWLYSDLVHLWKFTFLYTVYHRISYSKHCFLFYLFQTSHSSYISYIYYISGLFVFFAYILLYFEFLLYAPIFLRNLLYKIFHYMNFCFSRFCGDYILLNFSENSTKKVDNNLWVQYTL